MVWRGMGMASLLCLAAGAFACSKTQDTAPERRIFGSPPAIESVNISSIASSSATCDWTASLRHALVCTAGLDPATLPDPFPTITVVSTYNEVKFEIRVTDPESTPAQTDILLVTASYISNAGSSAVETSLVILDDGGTNNFPFQQKTDWYGEACTTPDVFVCEDCSIANYELDSNDAMAGDGLYTRGFAFKKTSGGTVPAGARASNLFEDCLVAKKKQAPAETTNLGTDPVAFKLEAIDRSGNIATWPVQPEVAIQPSGLTCTGSNNDLCGCCLLLSNNPFSPPSPTHPNPIAGCRGLRGLNGQPGSGYENGFCTTL